jgi:hypothetical protein
MKAAEESARAAQRTADRLKEEVERPSSWTGTGSSATGSASTSSSFNPNR